MGKIVEKAVANRTRIAEALTAAVLMPASVKVVVMAQADFLVDMAMMVEELKREAEGNG